jgi:FtsP/CotA-like multicopper oxidase with cupredoxin domain
MNRPAPRAAALAASLLLVLAGCGDDDDDTAAQDPTPTPAVTTEATSSASASASGSSSTAEDEGEIQVVEINLEDGKPTEKVGPTVTVAKGDKLTLVITSDSDREIHVHGLDTYIEVPAGESVTKTLTITLSAGSYEVEVHETEFLLFNLQVK